MNKFLRVISSAPASGREKTHKTQSLVDEIKKTNNTKIYAQVHVESKDEFH